MAIMQGFLVVTYQLKRFFTGLIDINILFELVSLLHLIVTEQKMTVHQLIFNQKVKGHKSRTKFEYEQRIIKYMFFFACFYVTIG